MEHILWFSVIIVILVFIHELGHFLFARLFNVHVEKFSIGFGPSLLKYRDSKKTEWLLSLIPLGGYVKLKGYDLEFENDAEDKIAILSDLDKSNLFYLKPLWQKTLIVIAGPGFNYLLAVGCFALLFFLSGVPTPNLRVQQIQANSIADNLGVRVGDIVHEINGLELSNVRELQKSLSKVNETIYLKIIRNNEIKEIQFPWPNGNERTLGILFDVKLEKKGIVDCLIVAFQKIYVISKAMIVGIFDMVSGKFKSDSIGGPLQIAKFASTAAAQGPESFIYFLALLSLNLGLINLLPIPMLDGGHLLFYLIEILTRKKVNKKLKFICFRMGLVILMSIMVLAIVNDLKSLF